MTRPPVHRVADVGDCAHPTCPLPAAYATRHGRTCTTHTHPAHQRLAAAFQRDTERKQS